ncbi:hypothetical protein ACWD45_26620 [Streptomyces rubiginosohelvolus]
MVDVLLDGFQIQRRQGRRSSTFQRTPHAVGGRQRTIGPNSQHGPGGALRSAAGRTTWSLSPSPFDPASRHVRVLPGGTRKYILAGSTITGPAAAPRRSTACKPEEPCAVLHTWLDNPAIRQTTAWQLDPLDATMVRLATSVAEDKPTTWIAYPTSLTALR